MSRAFARGAGPGQQGIGPGQSEIAFDYSTHSMYVRILTENGFVGFAAFYAFVFWSWFRATRLALMVNPAHPLDGYSRDVFMLTSASLLGLMINGFVIDTIHWRELGFLTGLAWWVPGSNSLRQLRALP